MQLNNNTTGEVIIISQINTKQNNCVVNWYEIYASSVQEIKLQKVHNFTTINLNDFLDSLNNIKQICLNALMTELNLDETWIINTDNPYNWLYPARPIRIFVENSLILEETAPVDDEGHLLPFGQLIEREKLINYGFYYCSLNGKYTTLYCNIVDPEDEPIIAPYIMQGRVIVETMEIKDNQLIIQSKK